MSSDLPSSLLQFLRQSVPTYQAAEVLLFLAAHPDREFSAEEIVVEMRPVTITVPAVKEYCALFRRHGLLGTETDRFAYAPESATVEGLVGQLAHAYNERPVTLIGAIYRIADSNIQSFADSLKLRRDEP